MSLNHRLFFKSMLLAGSFMVSGAAQAGGCCSTPMEAGERTPLVYSPKGAPSERHPIFTLEEMKQWSKAHVKTPSFKEFQGKFDPLALGRADLTTLRAYAVGIEGPPNVLAYILEHTNGLNSVYQAAARSGVQHWEDLERIQFRNC